MAEAQLMREIDDDDDSTCESVWQSFLRNVHSVRRKYDQSDEAKQAIEELLILARPLESHISALEGKGAVDPVREVIADSNTAKLAFVKEQEQHIKGCLDYSQYDEALVIKCQRTVRGWIGKRRLQNMAIRALSDPSTKKLRKRNDVWREIISTEDTYVRSLELLNEKLIIPIRKQLGTDGEVLSSGDVKAVFSNIQQLLTIHNDLLAKLQESVKQWPSCNNIGEIFLAFAPYLRLYQEYVNNFSHAYAARQKNKDNAAFTKFLDDTLEDPAFKKMQLSSFLIMPIQRIPRYQMLLRELIKYTTPEHTDYENLSKALAQIEQIADILDKRKKEVENIESVFNVFNSISGALPLRIADVRYYIREGPITKGGHKKKRYFFLFNDVLLVCVVNSNGKKVFEEEYWMKEVETEGLADPCSFQICKGKAKAKWVAATQNEKESWVSDLQSMRKELLKKLEDGPSRGSFRAGSLAELATTPKKR